ncbi:hypothetical protein [Thalassomonas actiniarum]|uniref:Uncharacterized protein n=1 Tax=Thalassomonas actiniarum TaxID=485447 RepID=A0AAF0C4B5_9GAMM|nr:hypothetical protein [Thalassomonas actiniarum]WDD99624.1 hypothetical protein SG35_002820 [Thalassomonas actiniarum]
MKQQVNTAILVIVALIIVSATLLHGSLADISIFHGLILHPVFLLAGLSLFACAKEQRKTRQ